VRVNDRSGFRFGFGLSGLLSAGLAYMAYDAGYFSGAPWIAFLTAAVIGTSSAFSMILLEKAVVRLRKPAGADARPARIKGGDWGCPRCGSAYVREATVCSDCDVPLVEAGPGR
jgi:hypothetical protein